MRHELLILRHGKAAPDDGHGDYPRPLTARGTREAGRIGRWLRQQRLLPDVVLSSPAMRARDTALAACQAMDFPLRDIRYEEPLYLADLDALLAAVRNLPAGARRVLLVGHNPGLEQLLRSLTRDPLPTPADGKLLATATLARLALSTDWAGCASTPARLLSLTRAATLPPA
jgi:phosphohistidine phosphatase